MPLIPTEHPLTGSAGLSRYYLHLAAMSFPFLWEMRTSLDWTVARTSLSLFEWLKLEDIYAGLVSVRATMAFKLRSPRGAQRTVETKLGTGALFVAAVLLLILGPMFVFSSANPISEANLVRSAQARHIDIASTLKAAGLLSPDVESPRVAPTTLVRVEKFATPHLTSGAPDTAHADRPLPARRDHSLQQRHRAAAPADEPGPVGRLLGRQASGGDVGQGTRLCEPSYSERESSFYRTGSRRRTAGMRTCCRSTPTSTTSASRSPRRATNPGQSWRTSANLGQNLGQSGACRPASACLRLTSGLAEGERPCLGHQPHRARRAQSRRRVELRRG